MALHLSPHFFSFFFLIITTSIIVRPPTSSQADHDVEYQNCSALFQCANIPNIGYPFWGSSRTENCGYPGFELSCDDSLPRISIGDKTHYIRSINSDTKTLVVAREDYWFSNCPSDFSNYTINFDLLYYSSNTRNMTLFYNCPEVSPDMSPFLSPYQFYCRRFVNSSINVYVRDLNSLAPAVSDYLENCTERVIVPVLPSTASNVPLAYLSDAINGGFELQWSANNVLCDECQGSNGVCGYNTSTNRFTCYCSDHPYDLTCPRGISAGLGGTVLLFVLVICLRRRNHLSCQSLINQKNQTSNNQDVEAFIRNNGSLTPKHYKYSDVKKMTNSFLEKIGQGGYGAVYKGKLLDGRSVAVKILSKAKENEHNGEEFMNEVACISRCSHVNIVNLLGFCYERHKRALIYEYMPNGSLDRFIYNQASLTSNPHLEWKALHQIVVGVARGLEYLHRGCNTRIVHFDIKPHNILLDEHFCPKISDFGLAKQYKNKESIMSMLDARGTIGYIAPEVIYRHFGEVSYKSDVYGYGMMVLEMVGVRRNVARGVSNKSEKIFPDWIYELIKIKDDLTLHEMVVTTEDEELLRKMILVSLWCIQINPLDRPSMSKVVEMLEGELQSLQIPPKPVLYTPSDPLQDSSIASESSS